MALVNAARRAPVRVVWKPIPGLLYKHPRALESVLKEKKSKGVHIQERAERGLFGGKRVHTSWKVGGDKRRKNYSKRWRKPNAQKRWIVSEVLGFRMQVNMTVSAMRDMDFYGSFDDYILKASERKIDSAFGIVLKRAMYTKLAWEKEQRERYERELAEWNAANGVVGNSSAEASSSPSPADSTSTNSSESTSVADPVAASASTSAPPLTPEQEQDAHPLLSPDRPTLVEKVLRSLPESESESESTSSHSPEETRADLFPVIGEELAQKAKDSEQALTALRVNEEVRAPVTPLPRPNHSEVDQVIAKLERSGEKPRDATLWSQYKPRGRSTYWPSPRTLKSHANFCIDENGEKVLELTPQVILDMVKPEPMDFVGFDDADADALETAKAITQKCDADINVAILPRVDAWSYKQLKRAVKRHQIIADSHSKKLVSM